MPITVVATEGVLTEQARKQVFAELTDAFLKHHGVAGNTFMTPNVIGEIILIPKGQSFSGGKQADIVVVGLTVPSFTFGTDQQKQGFIGDVTDIIHRATGGQHPRERTWVNVTYAVDGMWGIAGKAYSNVDLGAALQSAAA